VFHLITALISLYLAWRFVWPLPWGKAAKTSLAVLIILVAEHHLVTRTFFGTMASPEVPSLVLTTLGWAFGSLILLALVLLVRDITGALSYVVSRKLGLTLLTDLRLHYGIGVAAIVLSGIGVWEATRIPRVKTIEISLPRLPLEFDGFRIVQLTDLHASRLLQAPWITTVVAKANALTPDLIVITGDLADGTPEARTADVQPLQDLTARYGVFAIPGNHEYYSDYLRWLHAFDQMGLRMLLNEHVIITRDGRNLVLAGITDITASTFALPPPDIDSALNGMSKTDPVILLSHRPLATTINARAGVDLQLSGHTHGGQILGPHIIAQWVNEGFVSGQYDVNGMKLYVSNGVGLWNGFPLRLGRPSEITQIVLRSSQRTSMHD